MPTKNNERFFNIRIFLSGDPDTSLDPIPLLEAHLRDMKENNEDTLKFYSHDGEDAYFSNSASWPLVGRLL